MCPCGKPALARGLCLPCYDRQRLANLRFAGHREPVIDRDGRQCTICSSPDRLIRSFITARALVTAYKSWPSPATTSPNCR